ncbi:ribosome silencing factor [Lentisphaera profundi]|uniref:Ribosomal silencing factor RsfS n=1 Tax=Lentisphaera profundi TaxID=1658616 RepID=A0ABY7VVM1_9BACT|nr:ribosome silencing factor [Lentisphaera profundi]WDE97819.1 ribosome silencing factor [Lentisphaera profundi]
MSQINSEAKAKLIAELCEESKAVDIKTIDVKETSSITDYYVICTGNSEPHLKAIANRIHLELKDQDMDYNTVDADEQSHWVVQDYGNVILHIFHPDARRHYNIEEFWKRKSDEFPYECPENQILRDELMRRNTH